MGWSFREVPPGTYPVTDVFSGLDASHVLTALFPDEAERAAFLRDARVVVTPEEVYGYVDEDDGEIHFGHGHLTKGEKRTVYLDILHELVHVKQLKEGRDLYDKRYAYVDRPTEIEAYTVVVEEGRLLEMTEAEIAEYLFVEWASPADHERLCRRLGVKASATSRRRRG